MNRLRNFMFTCFSTEDHRNTIKLGDIFSFIVYQIECCPSTKKLHIQGYGECKKQTRFNTVKSALPEGTHIEPRKGTQEQAIAYCMKLESHIEGPFTLGEAHKQGKRNDIQQFVNDIKTHSELEIVEKHPECYVKYTKAYDRIKQIYEEDRNWETEVIVFWGPPGSGKTRKVFEECPDVQPIQYTNNFIIGYNNEENVLFDDFDHNTIPRNIFLTLTDRYKCTVNVKGGEKKWNPKRIYITSNYDPETWYNNPKAILRRLKSVSNVYVSEVA